MIFNYNHVSVDAHTATINSFALVSAAAADHISRRPTGIQMTLSAKSGEYTQNTHSLALSAHTQLYLYVVIMLNLRNVTSIQL